MINDLKLHELPFGNTSYKLIANEDNEYYEDELNLPRGTLQIPSGNDSYTHTLTSTHHGTICIVMMSDTIEYEDVLATIAHEAVHIKQGLMQQIGEDNPSDEFEAYTIDSIFETLLSDYKQLTGYDGGVMGSIGNWFDIAYPNPTLLNAAVQIGVHMEEFAEMLDALDEDSTAVKELAEKYKSKKPHKVAGKLLQLSDEKQIELLDSFCDQLVTAIGSAKYLGFNIIGALEEVDASNWSKFEDGEPLFDENGKVTKGEDYLKPELGRFVGSTGLI